MKIFNFILLALLVIIYIYEIKAEESTKSGLTFSRFNKKSDLSIENILKRRERDSGDKSDKDNDKDNDKENEKDQKMMIGRFSRVEVAKLQKKTKIS
jgi:hypothetical protein